MSVKILEELPSGGFLKFRNDQLYQVRKMFNLEKPERLKESLLLLKDWVQKQDHFIKKDYSDEYYERLLISTKGSLERSKKALDRLCTFRTIWPQFFASIDIKHFKKDFQAFNSIVLPDVTENYARVCFSKILSNVQLDADLISKFIQYGVIIGEYCKMRDYPNGFVIFIDCQNVNLLDLLAVLSPTKLQQMLTLYMDGYGMRIQGIHVITTSKVTDALVNLLKQVLSKKIGSRIHVHRDYETIYEYLPKKILPAEYGGDAGSLNDMFDKFHEELSSPDHVDYMTAINNATIDEAKKPKDNRTDEYIGMSGSFRTLSVD